MVKLRNNLQRVYNEAFMKMLEASGKTKISIDIHNKLLGTIDKLSRIYGGKGGRAAIIEKFMVIFMSEYLSLVENSFIILLRRSYNSNVEKERAKKILADIKKLKSDW